MIEVLMASLLASVVAGGMMMAFLAAARMRPPIASETSLEANGLAQQTLEWIRNQVASETPNWFASQVPLGWQADPLAAAASSESILNLGAVRMFCVKPADCDSVGGVGDCYAVDVRVCWNGTPCPAGGAACP